MAKYTGPRHKMCRRLGEKVCDSQKCPVEKRAYAPGQHGQNSRRKLSEYGIRLLEKQKLRNIYGVLEKQFRHYYEKAAHQQGVTGENLLITLERRFDNVIFRLGFAPSRRAARQLVRHRHFTVNDQIVDIPSFLVGPGDVIKVREGSKRLEVIHKALRDSGRSSDLAWFRLDKAHLEGEMLALPQRSEIPTPIQEQLIVEWYSR